MKIEVEPGTYIVAVSGGVDSMVLLDLLNKLPGLELIVAHFDHGIRGDSAEDAELVRITAKKYGLKFIDQEGNLGPAASEAVARKARYAFLRAAQKEYGSKAIITAHHQDDVIETAIINLLRGTNRRGLSSLRSEGDLVRPLLKFSKADILAYAKAHSIVWHEDSTNEDESYLRNYVRRQLLPKLSEKQRQAFRKTIDSTGDINVELDTLLAAELNTMQTPGGLDRPTFIGLEHSLAREILALWLRQQGLSEYDKKTLERLVVAAKTGRPGALFDVVQGTQMVVGKDSLALRASKR